MENKTDSSEHDENMDIEQIPRTFMSFQVKDDMKIAPITRRNLNSVERSHLDNFISSDPPSTTSYLSELNNNTIVPRKTGRTWQDDDDEKFSNADDLFVIGNECF